MTNDTQSHLEEIENLENDFHDFAIQCAELENTIFILEKEVQRLERENYELSNQLNQ